MKNLSNDLSEFSSSYYEKADVYKIFSQAEDSEGFIWETLKNEFLNKKILDLGCGNGRYLEHINSISDYCFGVDQSLPQIQQSSQSLPFIVADGTSLPFANGTFDCILSCWVWGTILDENKREKLFEEAKRVLKKGGSIYLVENDTPSEFEYYRGRHLNTKTQDYNDWIIQRGFETFSQIETFITFKSVEEAQYVFEEIWKGRLFAKPTKNKIQNNVIIFKLKID